MRVNQLISEKERTTMYHAAKGIEREIPKEVREAHKRNKVKKDSLRSNILKKIKSAQNIQPKERKKSTHEATLRYLLGKISESEARALGVHINGGKALVSKKMQKEIIAYAQEENPIRKYATIHKTKGLKGVPIQTKKAVANVVVDERDEKNPIPVTEIEFDEKYLAPVEIDALAKVTKKLLSMSDHDVEKTMVEELSKACVRKEAYWFINSKENSGSLVNQAIEFVPKEPVDSTYLKLVRLKNALPSSMKKGAVWMMNRAAETLLESILDTTGNPVLKEMANSNLPSKIFRYPVEVSDYFDDVSGPEKPVIYFGNFSYFHIQDVLDVIEVQRLNELFTDENKIGFSVYNLLDGQVIRGPFEVPIFKVTL